ncbi:ribosomal protein S16 [Viridothelium virens]|uniref:Ribosomal protein S16 n=1 Tax=Viridothelium virens TaxID=1048519 RepID=A0A6A6GW41_VIRVR|nr:ribosomal protein S16 [Viridothelium virens]
MVVRIRLARFGKRHQPIYNIVVANARTARNSKPLEVLGTYDPIPKQSASGEGRKYKDIKVDISRAKYWLGVGAQPSDPAWRLMAMLGLIEPKYRPGGMQQGREMHEQPIHVQESVQDRAHVAQA